MTKKLTKGLLDITVAGAVAGPTIGILGSSGLPAPIVSGTSSLIGVGLLKGAADIIPKERGNKNAKIKIF